MPSAQRYTYCLPVSDRAAHWRCSSCQDSVRRVMVLGDSPPTSTPTSACSASGKSLLEMPLRYSQGINASIARALRKYRGRIFELNFSA